ncbi:hypothetical protein [Rhodosalinus sp. 5P4]|uniref:acyltransferase n=1 Tax=Rhodosalinus sp. 5P4 TaxID=3239196 RepID=UPI0035247193
MGYLTQDALKAMGFAHLGKNVKISDKASIYEPEKMEIGDNSRIDDFCVVSGKVEMGRNTHLSPFCLVNGGKVGIFIGDFTGLSFGTKVFAHTDDCSGEAMIGPTVPREFTNVRAQAVHLGRHVVTGAGTIIAAGVTLGDGVATGAATLVLKSLDGWGIYAGMPARRLRDRSRHLLQIENEYLQKKTQD